MDAEAGTAQRRPLLARVTGRLSHQRINDFIGGRRYPSHQLYGGTIARWRSKTRSFLNSRWGHYLVLLLVAIDVVCILATFLIELHTCEQRQRHHRISPKWEVAQQGLEVASLVFSCLFMVELIAATWSYGLSYFSSTFHIFDATVIVAAFLVDVAFRSAAGSIIVALRLSRVFKLLEELSATSEEVLEQCDKTIERLREENTRLKRRLNIDIDEEAGDEDL